MTRSTGNAYTVARATGHRLRFEERVVDRRLRRLGRRRVERVESIIVLEDRLLRRRDGKVSDALENARCRKRNDQVAAADRRREAGARHSHRRAQRDRTKLTAVQRRVGSDHDDDASAAEPAFQAGVLAKDRPILVAQTLPDGDSENRQLATAASGIVVDQHADSIAARVARENARRGADTGAKTERVHGGSRADAAARELPGRCRIEQRDNVRRRYGPGLNVVEQRVVAFRHDRQRNVVAAADGGMVFDYPAHDAIRGAPDVERVG